MTPPRAGSSVPTKAEDPALFLPSGKGNQRGYPGPVPVTCAFCGTAAPDEEPPLTWTTAIENGRSRVFCDQCSREHLRAMESKLDSEWW